MHKIKNKKTKKTELLKIYNKLKIDILFFSGSLDLSSSVDVHHLPVKIRPSPPCFAAARNSTEVQVIIQPVQKEVPQGKQKIIISLLPKRYAIKQKSSSAL